MSSTSTSTTTSTTTSTPNSSQTRKKNRMTELRKLASASEGKQKFGVIKANVKIPGQQVRLYAKNHKNNYVGRQLQNNNPSEYLRQKMKLTAKERQLENTRKSQAAFVSQARGRTRGPGSRGNAASRAANNITRRIREAREKHEKK